MAQQLAYQKQSGMVNQATAVRTGGHIGAEYMLNGNLSSIVKNAGGKSDVYYKFTFKYAETSRNWHCRVDRRKRNP